MTSMQEYEYSWTTAFVLVLCTYFSSQAAWRLFYHPLSKFPGPQLAALTQWYKCYYELFLDGALVEHLEELHKRYGPVVRIAPNELHFSAPNAFPGIYHTGSKFTKDPFFYKAFGEGLSVFVITDAQAARARRDILNPAFSRRAVMKFESVIQERVGALTDRILSYETNKQPVNLPMAFRSTSLDVITSHCFAKSYNAIEADGFRHPIVLALESSFKMPAVVRYFPSLRSMMRRMPKSVGIRMNPHVAAFLTLVTNISAQLDRFLLLADSGMSHRAEQECILHQMLDPNKERGSSYKAPPKHVIIAEGINFLFAGTDTVANTCTVGTFYVLNNRDVYSKLFEELSNAWDDKGRAMSYESLEKLPYLSAVIKESLRMAHGLVSPLPRIVGPTNSEIAGYDVPAGVAVSIGSSFLHNNPDIFPDPFTFSPDRWLQPNSRELEPYLVSFSRGPRSCIGVNLAWCELYIIFGNLFRKVDMELFETTVDDLKWRALLVAIYRKRPVQVLVKERAV